MDVCLQISIECSPRADSMSRGRARCQPPSARDTAGPYSTWHLIMTLLPDEMPLRRKGVLASVKVRRWCHFHGAILYEGFCWDKTRSGPRFVREYHDRLHNGLLTIINRLHNTERGSPPYVASAGGSGCHTALKAVQLYSVLIMEPGAALAAYEQSWRASCSL